MWKRKGKNKKKGTKRDREESAGRRLCSIEDIKNGGTKEEKGRNSKEEG